MLPITPVLYWCPRDPQCWTNTRHDDDTTLSKRPAGVVCVDPGVSEAWIHCNTRRTHWQTDSTSASTPPAYLQRESRARHHQQQEKPPVPHRPKRFPQGCGLHTAFSLLHGADTERAQVYPLSVGACVNNKQTEHSVTWRLRARTGSRYHEESTPWRVDSSIQNSKNRHSALNKTGSRYHEESTLRFQTVRIGIRH